MNLFDLTGLQVVISGGAGWLGTAMTRAFLQHGAEVTIVSRNVEAVQQQCADMPGSWQAIAADVRTEAWPAAIAAVAQQHGKIDVLVNNAHIGRGDSLESSTRNDYLEAIDLAVAAAARGVEAAKGGLRAAVAQGGSPCVINVASMYGIVAPDPTMYETKAQQNPPYYGAAKAALIQLTRYMAAELGPEGIRANAIAPGPFPSAETTSAQPEFAERLAGRTMLRRVGTPNEIASTALYLASPASSFTTGAVIPVDGGWIAW